MVYVALRASAWIETNVQKVQQASGSKSRSVRARGLKPESAQLEIIESKVALRASAWIETGFRRSGFKRCKSRSVRARGLKP